MYDVIHRFLYKYLYSTMYTICVYYDAYAYSFLFIFFTDGEDETVWVTLGPNPAMTPKERPQSIPWYTMMPISISIVLTVLPTLTS